MAEVGFRLRSRLPMLLTDLRAHEHTIFATASLQEGKTPRQCLQENLAPDCNSFRYAYFECKRSLVSSLVGCSDTQAAGSHCLLSCVLHAQTEQCSSPLSSAAGQQTTLQRQERLLIATLPSSWLCSVCALAVDCQWSDLNVSLLSLNCTSSVSLGIESEVRVAPDMPLFTVLPWPLM